MELSDAFGNERRSLEAIIRRLSGTQMDRKITDNWTVKDILGHLAAYHEVERLALAAGLGRGREEPVFFESIQPWNEEQYQQRRERSPSRIIAEFEENSARYLSLIKSLHEEDLIKRIRLPWGGTGTVHEMIVEGLDHTREHRKMLEETLGQTSSGGSWSAV
jgi:hypothetical protein